MPARRRFGSVRRLPSGRWQARYWDAADNRITAPDDVRHQDRRAAMAVGRGDRHGPRRLARPSPRRRPVRRVGRPVDGDQGADARRRRPQDLYRYLLRKHVVPRFGSMPVGRITAATSRRWLADLHSQPSSARTPSPRPTAASAARWTAPSTPGSSPARRARSRAPAPNATPRCRSPPPSRSPTSPPRSGPAGRRSCSPPRTPGCAGASSPGSADATSTSTRNLITVTRKLGEVNGQLSFGPPKTAAGKRTIGMPVVRRPLPRRAHRPLRAARRRRARVPQRRR